MKSLNLTSQPSNVADLQYGLHTKEQAGEMEKVSGRTKRLNINLPAQVFSDLVNLSKRSGRSMTEIVRIALGLVKIALDETERGNKLVVTTSTGDTIKELIIP